MGAKVSITWEGLDEVLGNLSDIEEKGQENLVKQTAELASQTEAAWKEATHRRSGRLQDAEQAKPDGLSFTLNDDVYYYDWVNSGHETARGWRTKHGYRPAKHRSHVAGQEMTEKAIDFVEEHIEDALSSFLDGV